MSIKIDKSRFTPAELASYEALIAKATVDPAAAEDEMEREQPKPRKRRRPEFEEDNFFEEETDRKRKRPKFVEDNFFEENTEKADDEMVDTEKCKTRKSADPYMTAAMERLEKLEKSLAMQEFTEVAKKYAPLGENETELAEMLYEMKKSNEANYDAYIGILDKSLGLIEKSGLFAEIGKSASGYGAMGGTVEQVEAIAAEIMKSDTSLTRDQAIAKAWTDHPELVAEYDREYNGR